MQQKTMKVNNLMSKMFDQVQPFLKIDYIINLHVMNGLIR